MQICFFKFQTCFFPNMEQNNSPQKNLGGKNESKKTPYQNQEKKLEQNNPPQTIEAENMWVKQAPHQNLREKNWTKITHLRKSI